MTALSYPQPGQWDSNEVSSGFLRFSAREFETTLDDQSESSTASGTVHDIYLPYPDVVSTDTAIWDQGANDGLWGYTDADVNNGGIWTWISKPFTTRAVTDAVEMELSMAAFKMPQLRQRHYSWNLINREEGDGEVIATICRSFQASVYPRMQRGAFGAVKGWEMVNPPPMWDVSFARPGAGGSPRPGAWRWHMDQFLSVLLSVTISPTQLTDGSMAVAIDGFPLATTLKMSFLETSQAVASPDWTAIVPYSVATDRSNMGTFGASEGMSEL